MKSMLTIVFLIAAVVYPIAPACAADFIHWRKQAKSAKKLEDRMTALKQMATWKVSEEGTSAKEVASGVAIGLSDKRIEAQVYAARLLGLVEDKETALTALAKALRIGSSELKKARKKVAKRQRLFFKFLTRVLPEAAPLAKSSYIDLAMLRDNIKHLRVWSSDVNNMLNQVIKAMNERSKKLAVLIAYCEGLQGVGSKAALEPVLDLQSSLLKKHRAALGDLAPILLAFGTEKSVSAVVESLDRFDYDSKAFTNWNTHVTGLAFLGEEEEVILTLPDEGKLWGPKVYKAIEQFADKGKHAALPKWKSTRYLKHVRAWYDKVGPTLE